jgi:hypothetical protein
MSACFYDMGGVMVGFMDLHTYIVAPKIPNKATPHVVGTPFERLSRMGEIDSVTSEGMKMAKQGFKVFLVPHVPLTTAAPGPDEPLMLTIVHLTSKTTAYLSRGTVTHGGTPLACCVASMVGANANCGKGDGWVINPNSVVTTPSAGDFAGAIVGYALDLLCGEALGKVLPKDVFVKPVLKFLLGLTVKKWFVSPHITDVRKQVQEIVDELL